MLEKTSSQPKANLGKEAKGTPAPKSTTSSADSKIVPSPRHIKIISLLPEEDLKLIDEKILGDFETAIEFVRAESKESKGKDVSVDVTTTDSPSNPQLSEQEVEAQKKKAQKEKAQLLCRCISSLYLNLGRTKRSSK